MNFYLEKNLEKCCEKSSTVELPNINTCLIEGKLPLVGLALMVSIVGTVLTIIDSKNNFIRIILFLD